MKIAAILVLLVVLPVQAQEVERRDMATPKTTSLVRLPIIPDRDPNQPVLDIFDGIHVGAEFENKFRTPHQPRFGAYGELSLRIPYGGLFGSIKFIVSEELTYRIDLSKRIF